MKDLELDIINKNILKTTNLIMAYIGDPRGIAAFFHR
jgi:hypothetical protein